MRRFPGRFQPLVRGEAGRIGLLMALAALMLAWIVSRTELVFADGLRYIEQAQGLNAGVWKETIRKGVDHPLYPMAIALTHDIAKFGQTPEGWQGAAQTASALAAVLLVLPLYLVGKSVYGRSSAWLGVVLVFLSPTCATVFADTLSESTFLLFWTWGLWATFHYLRSGAIRQLFAALVFGGLAYLVRPEGILLPLAIGGTLAIIPFVPEARFRRRQWWSAILFLGLGAASLIGPFIALKGGLGTKPGVARLLGLTAASKPGAVEREKPLDPSISSSEIYGQAVRAAAVAVKEAVGVPLLVLSAIGFLSTFWRKRDLRATIFLAIVIVGYFLALVRLHATGGYCTPRHALLIALTLIPAAAAGFRSWLAGVLKLARGGKLPNSLGLRTAWVSSTILVLGLLTVSHDPFRRPLNMGFSGYREAGKWIDSHVEAGARVVDVTGLSLFYAKRPGYVFANLIEAPGDRDLRWVVVRDSHLYGPWPYCETLRSLVQGARVVGHFPVKPREGQARITIYDRSPTREQASIAGSREVR